MLGQGNQLTDDIMINFLTTSMPDGIKREIDYERKRLGDNLTFVEAIAKFETRYGGKQTAFMRKKWQEVSLPNVGKITTDDWRDFEINFKGCGMEVSDANPKDAYRLLVKKLPSCLLGWVYEHEHKMLRENPKVNLIAWDEVICD